jgi:hypothetical protein
VLDDRLRIRPRASVVQEAHYAHSVATEEQLFDRSGEVALAQAATVRYLKTPTGLAYTLQTFVVRESFVGGASPGSHITLQFPGGELDRTRATGPADPKGYFVIDSSWPTFAPDAEYLLFLEETPTVDVHSEGARVAVSQGVGAYQVSGRRLVPPPSLRDHPVAKALQGRDYQEVGRAAAERRRVR